MLVLQCTTVGMPRVFSKAGAGLPWKVPPLVTGPPMASTVVAGHPAGSICTVVCESLIVYSLRITLPDQSVMTVGAKTCGIGSWVTNCVMLVGSIGSWLAGTWGVGVKFAGHGPDADLLVPMEVVLSAQPLDMTASETTARTNTPLDTTEAMRFCFVVMITLVLRLASCQPAMQEKKWRIRSLGRRFPRSDVASRMHPRGDGSVRRQMSP